MESVTVIILTHQEEIHIARCILSLKPIVSRILVVDSFSTDNTVQIAESLGAQVIQRKWKNYADQFQWGLDNCIINTKWVMRMDADEYLDSDLQQELPDLLKSASEDQIGIYLKRKVFFEGKWIRFGGFYPQILLRVWRPSKGHIEQRWMDEHIILLEGSKTIIAKGHIIDDNLKGITFWIDKHNKYASREAVDLLSLKYDLLPKDNDLKISTDPQAKRKRIIKEKIYAHLPSGLRVLIYFFYRYFILLGFLDGTKGFVWHFLQGFWYRFLVDIKISEIEKKSGGDLEKMKRLLRDEHGLQI